MRYEAWSTSDQALTFGWGGGRGGKPFPRLGTKTRQLKKSVRRIMLYFIDLSHEKNPKLQKEAQRTNYTDTKLKERNKLAEDTLQLRPITVVPQS